MAPKPFHKWISRGPALWCIPEWHTSDSVDNTPASVFAIHLTIRLTIRLTILGVHPTQPAYSLMRFLFIWRSLANDEDRPQGRLASRTFGRTAFSGADKLIHYRKLWKIKFENNLPFLLFAGKPQMAFRCFPLPLNRLLSSMEFSGMLAVSYQRGNTLEGIKSL